LVRLAILHSSRARLLAAGGAAAFEEDGPSDGDARAREVFAAFLAFRDAHCLPEEKRAAAEGAPQPQHEGKHREAAAEAAAEGSSDRRPRQLWWDAPPAAAGAPAAAPPAALLELEAWAAAAQASAARLLVAGELLHVLRPLLYVAALRRGGRRSWGPWALSLALELASARLTAAGAAASRRAAAAAAARPAVAGTSLAPLYALQGVRWRREEADELTRRKLLLLFCLARDPFFGRFTGPALARWRRRLGRLPLVGWAAEKAAEVAVGAQKYYTYTAAS
jgi:hypothetical protein